jgi:adenosylcobinamide-GDP ribazoletransferase
MTPSSPSRRVADRSRFTDGLRLAVATLTVAPMRADKIDRDRAAVAMSVAPVVGALLGVALAAVGIIATSAGATPFVAAVLVVAAGALLTRGLHLDGLADTADGLGSYRPPAAALEIMRRPDIGPFGVVVLVLTLFAQVSAATSVLARPWPAALVGVVTAVAGGRVAITFACRRGVPAARPDGLGALVAGTVASPTVVVGALGLAALAIFAVPGRPWQGPLAVLLAGLGTALLLRRARVRLGGVTGDVLGAACEVATTVIYVVVSM